MLALFKKTGGGTHFESLADLGAHYLAQAGLEFTELHLPLPPQFWN